MRTKAGCSLVSLLEDPKVQEKRVCRAIVERQSSEVLFCPDKETREVLIGMLLDQEVLPENLHTEHLSSIYRTHALEINNTTVHRTSSCFVNHGMFQRRKVTVLSINSLQKLMQTTPSCLD